MTNVVKLRRRPRPLKKSYSPDAPYVVTRVDHDDGTIAYEVYDERPETYRLVCSVYDFDGENPYAKHDTEQVARGLNLLVQYGKEKLPSVRDVDAE